MDSSRIKSTLYQHQIDCVKEACTKPYYALFLECGLGKTLIALNIYAENFSRDPGHRALVICPNTLVENWAEEIQKHTTFTCRVLKGTKKRRIKLLNEPANIYIVNYDMTRILYPELISEEFDVVFADESQCIKNPKALRTKACLKIASSCHKRYIMTGTPIMNNPLDVYAQYLFLNPLVFGNNYYRFRGRYAVMGGFDNRVVTKWINMADFRRKVFSCAVRKTKDECLDLPAKLYEKVHLDMPAPQRKLYKELKEEFLSEFNDSVVTAPVMLTRILRFSQITAGFTKDFEGHEWAFDKNPKIEWIVDFLQSYQQKTVIFCRFLKEIDLLKLALDRAGIEYRVIQGSTKDRMKEVNDFNNTPTVQVFIGQIDTAGAGINLTSASYCVFASNTYSYGQRIQAEDRIHRIGQSKNVTFIDLLVRGSIDERVHQSLKNKKSLSTMVVDDIRKMICQESM
jgi:SNF2 family DNA or RNA helicase